MKLYNTKSAAGEIGISMTTICAMKRAGLVFSHGRLTFLKTVLDWMAANPGFRQSHIYRDRRQSATPKRISAAGRPSAIQVTTEKRLDEQRLAFLAQETKRKSGPWYQR